MSVVTAILTIAASGVVAAMIAYYLNSTKEHVFFMRQKIEALYLAFERYDKFLTSYYIPYYAVIDNQITYNDALDLEIKNAPAGGQESANGLDTTTMLVHVYFPHLRPQLERYIGVRDTLNKTLTEHKRAYKRGQTDGTPWRKPLNKGMRDLDFAATALKDGILVEARGLAPAARLWPEAITPAVVMPKVKKLLQSK
jgi:hypothetical protein